VSGRSVLVTGGAGFIGSHVAESLLRRGDAVRVLDNLDPFYDVAIKRRNLDAAGAAGPLDFIEGDCRDRATVRDAFRGVDAVLHLAARAGVRASLSDPAGYADVNVGGSAIVMDEAHRAGVETVVLASSSSVYGARSTAPFREDDPCDRPVSPYAATKRAMELLAASHAQTHGGAVICLRFFTAYGPRQRPEMAVHAFARAIAEGRPVVVLGDGSARRDFTYVDDIVKGVLSALDRPPGYRVYNLGEERTASVLEMISLLEAVMERRAKVEHRPTAAGDVPLTSADCSRARAELGYAPSVPLETGLRRFVEWMNG
jgi:UDP-glucuronate 4-epimerase